LSYSHHIGSIISCEFQKCLDFLAGDYDLRDTVRTAFLHHIDLEAKLSEIRSYIVRFS